MRADQKEKKKAAAAVVVNSVGGELLVVVGIGGEDGEGVDTGVDTVSVVKEMMEK